jgi:hypothetical protein
VPGISSWTRRPPSEVEDDVEPAKLTKREVNELRALDADVTANDRGPLAREGQCGCATDASAGSGHEADLPG